MGRYGRNPGHGFRCKYLDHGIYRISWTVDRYSRYSRLRNPVPYDMDVEEPSARRFCKKHGLVFPIPDPVKA
jgi:hypothetical protein